MDSFWCKVVSGKGKVNLNVDRSLRVVWNFCVQYFLRVFKIIIMLNYSIVIDRNVNFEYYFKSKLCQIYMDFYI